MEDCRQFVKRACQLHVRPCAWLRPLHPRVVDCQALGGNSRTTLLVAASACARASNDVCGHGGLKREPEPCHRGTVPGRNHLLSSVRFKSTEGCPGDLTWPTSLSEVSNSHVQPLHPLQVKSLHPMLRARARARLVTSKIPQQSTSAQP